MVEWATIRERISGKVSIEGDCWLWTGALDGDGYARMFFRGKNSRVSGVAWSAFNEAEWPEGAHRLHACDEKRCVNPKHIHPGSHAENMREASERRRFVNQAKTHCKRGHPFSPENTIQRGGRRICSQCVRIHRQINTARRSQKRAGLRYERVN